MASCRYCGKEITWMKDGRKNVPVEGDGAVHRCDNMINARKSFRKITPTEVDPELLKQYENAINEKAKK
ncbi:MULTISPECIES: hypothetical protein [Halobacteriovorax]|uniref:DUF2175 domain-containing protein n=1 Tax=Halobacteriovorax vibrionivorans TaxID=2152716 RepID=A0ABY0IHC6_9BACT|nr:MULTISPECIES: hypothetical protein [Halobacteriovorax]AYF45259.1 hypothetical protein BALOs_2261 [Halobacteriovorax sp. BALOs_7]RZF22346.1 hypothetical protein DAY19_00840 [Halobacteriovorax vibrionivorans]TGD48598.1 hypothetical protein EP118_03755 [Halobacteriovorax sp. Y22]